MTSETPLNYEDPAVCHGIHTWMYVYDPASEPGPWRMTATCVDCARVEQWDEHMARRPATFIEASGRATAALYLLWRATGIPRWLERTLRKEQP